MTVSLDARTPSASVHALSGSTPPGAGAVMQPFGVATAPAANLGDTFIPLGGAALEAVAGLTARRVAAHPDEDVINLAERVTRLARRERVLLGRRSAIEDAIEASIPPQPVRPPDPKRVSYNMAEVDGWRYTTLIEAPGPEYNYRADCEAHAAAVVERERQEAEVGSRLGLPRWEKLTDRASARLGRWGYRLAQASPRTQGGLKAKAEASRVIAEGEGPLLSGWRQQLATSISTDALRIIGAEADALAEADRTMDGGLLALGRKWQECAARHDRSVERKLAIEESVVVPAMPEALFFDSERDPPVLGAYTSTHVRTGRRCYGASSILSLRRPWHHDFCRARRDEILAAYDGWEAAQEAAEAAAGLPAAKQDAHVIATEHLALRQSILPMPAQTVEGALLKLRVARWCAGEVGAMEIDLETFVNTGEAENDAFLLAFALDAARLLDRCVATPAALFHTASAA